MKITAAKARTEIPIPEELRNAEVTIEAADESDFVSPIDLTVVKAELEQGLIDYFTANGFPADEVMDYSVVDVEEVADSYGHRIKAEVRYEPMFDEFELCSALDPIVQKYDKDAYFDLYDSGIAEAYIEVK